MFVLDTWVYLLLGALALLVGVIAYKLIRSNTGASPAVSAVLKALEPYAYKAILAGQTAILWGLDTAEAAIEATDKKAVADSWYDLLPDFILVAGYPVPSIVIKRLIPREEWQTFVKSLYDEFNAQLQRNEQYLKSQVEALKPG